MMRIAIVVAVALAGCVSDAAGPAPEACEDVPRYGYHWEWHHSFAEGFHNEGHVGWYQVRECQTNESEGAG